MADKYIQHLASDMRRSNDALHKTKGSYGVVEEYCILIPDIVIKMNVEVTDDSQWCAAGGSTFRSVCEIG
jgi:hypothetical protein